MTDVNPHDPDRRLDDSGAKVCSVHAVVLPGCPHRSPVEGYKLAEIEGGPADTRSATSKS